MIYNLKRCPFCNAHDLTLDVTIGTCAIRCVNCGAMGPVSTKTGRAVQFWNGNARHTNPSALVACRKSNHHERKTMEL